MFRKHNMGLDVRKLSCDFLRTTNAQTSLRIRSDLEITQLHQTRPSAYLVWSFFQFPLDFLMRCFFMFTRIPLKIAEIIVFPCNAGPVNSHKVANLVFNVGPSSVCQQIQWRFVGGQMSSRLQCPLSKK